jgi:hypothetical protein
MDQYQRKIDETKKEIADMDEHLNSLNKTLDSIKIEDETAAFEMLKDKLKELGVEGVDSAKDLEELKQKV